MLDSENPTDFTPESTTNDTPGGSPVSETAEAPAPAKKTARKTAAKKAPAKRAPAKKTAAKKTAAAPAPESPESLEPSDLAEPTVTGTETAVATGEASDTPAPAKKTAKKAAAKKAPAKKAAAKKTTTKKAAAKTAEAPEEPAGQPAAEAPEDEETDEATALAEAEVAATGSAPSATALLFQPPQPVKATARRTRKTAAPVDEAEPAAEAQPEAEAAEEAPSKPTARRRTRKTAAAPVEEPAAEEQAAVEPPAEATGDTGAEDQAERDEDQDDEQGGNRRRRRRGGRRRRKGSGSGQGDDENGSDEGTEDEQPARDQNGQGAQNGGQEDRESAEGSGSTRRRRRRRRAGEGDDLATDDPENTVVRVRKARNPEDEITALSGSTRLEAKKQRRREGREAGRRRAPIVSEAEFLARREAVDRVMVIRQRKDLTQIAVLEDKVLVEHYVARESQTSLIGNVYLGRVQNVLPSMEAAFIDIGKGRNAVLYAGEVNWDTLGAGNGPRKIEAVLKSGQSVLVQVTKDPIGHKGARLTSQISLPGRFLVYVPDGTTSGISRKLPDTERSRLKSLLKEIVPDSAGVIVRTAAEGASEEELTRDVERLTARWADIESKVEKGNAPQLLYGEPDLTLKVVRDLFTEDFGKLVVSGDDAWEMVQDYVDHVAPDLAERLEKHDASEDVFATFRIDEQIDKALDRKVWLPSGGSLIIDRTEAMTVVDVNTGKFTGSGGNLEETVTKNNLEAAEEIIRQLRLRDIGGIIVVDFIDMVLESNRDLVLRRMVECLGRDRTRHQVAEVTSLGLVQMTRKRIGTGLLEAFTENCEHCQGRGLITHHEPVEARKKQDEEPRRGRGRRGRGRDEQDGDQGSTAPSPKDVAAMARHEQAERADEAEQEPTPAEQAGATEAAPEERPEREPGEREGGRRRNRRRERPETDHGEEPAVEVTTPEPEVTTPEPEAAQQPVESPVQTPAPAAAPEGDGVVQQPLVRSSSRARGRASRPAGSPNRAAEEAAVMTVAPTAPTDGTQPEAPAAEPVAVETAAPRVVTSTRRRVASRPAGPPAAATSAAPPATDPEDGQPSLLDAAGEVEAGTGEHDGPDAGPVHVPVKKKGSRKR